LNVASKNNIDLAESSKIEKYFTDHLPNNKKMTDHLPNNKKMADHLPNNKAIKHHFTDHLPNNTTLEITNKITKMNEKMRLTDVDYR